jgi:metal-responsive CopG/Arc/MetJ family transcriptional regulator
MSDSVMQIRLPEDLLKAFQDACSANDQTASQVVRAMMREYVSRNAQTRLDLGGKRK